jgi:hypothetical protein
MLMDIALIIGGHDAHGYPFYQPWFHEWTLFHENSAFQPWTFVHICEWESNIENS